MTTPQPAAQPGRDYLGEMRAKFAGLVDADEDLDIPRAARELADDLRDTDPDLLSGWLWGVADATLADRLRSFNASRRHNWRDRNRREFGKVQRTGAFGAYRLRFQVESGDMRHLSNLTAEDCLFVAASYRLRAKANSRRARWFELRATDLKNSGRSTLEEIYDEGELTRLWEGSA